MAVQRFHWPPSRLMEWLGAGREVKAFYYASTEVRAKREKDEADRIEKVRKKGLRRRR